MRQLPRGCRFFARGAWRTWKSAGSAALGKVGQGLEQERKSKRGAIGAPLCCRPGGSYDEELDLREESTLVSELRAFELLAIRVSRFEYFLVIMVW